MRILDQIEPKNVLGFFEEICEIPHGSKNEKALSDHLVAFAKQRKLEVIQDASNNVIIIKEATKGYENAEPIMLQGHMDMVCEKVKESNHDFTKDPLRLKLNGSILTADGTTLGADNGIAVAMEMALLDSSDIEHPRLECIFTTDEETGLFGAEAIDISMLKSRKLINLDSEEEGIFTVSCAGGITAQSSLPLSYETRSGEVFELKVSGLQGGHSGGEINKERLNANILMGRVLYELAKEVSFRIVTINGGNADNVITKECAATIVVPCGAQAKKVLSIIERIHSTVAHECKVTDPAVEITAQPQGKQEVRAFDKDTTFRVYSILLIYPQGIYAMSMEIPGLVESSLNLGVLKTEEGSLRITAGIRSAVDSRIYFLADKVAGTAASFGGTTTFDGYYPGWEYKAESPLKDLMISVFKKQYGKEPVIEAIHAGLECGMFTQKVENLDCISIGPDLRDVHTPDESMDLDSVKRVWDFLLEVLKECK